MKVVYINEKRKLTKWKIKRIVRKVGKIDKEQKVAVAISNRLKDNEELLGELNVHNYTILNRKVAL